MTSAPSAKSAGEQPVGDEVHGWPAKLPEAIAFEGRFGRVEKLVVARHGDDLWRAIKGDEAIWSYMPYGPFPEEGLFRDWINERAARDDPYAYAVIDRDGRAVGVACLMEIRPAMRVIEVGSIFYAKVLQRTPQATEVQYLLARYSFETLGYRRYEWKCNALNAPSRRAAERFGFTFEAIFRQHMIVKGRSRDTAWYAMLDHEWPRAKAAFEQWLAPENFDGDGRQRRRLEDIRAALQK